MEASFSILGHRVTMDWPVAGAVFCVLAVVWGLMRRARLHASERMRDRRILREMEAYAALDVRMPDSDVRGLGMRVCGVVAEVSAFRKVAMMARDAEGRLVVAGCAGMDDFIVEVLNGWGEGWMRGAASGPGVRAGMRSGERVVPGMGSFVLELGERVWMIPAVECGGADAGGVGGVRGGE